jgi:hypothetical protein
MSSFADETRRTVTGIATVGCVCHRDQMNGLHRTGLGRNTARPAALVNPHSSPPPPNIHKTGSEVGASYTIYEKNWTCPSCKYAKNYGNHLKCTRCKARKPHDLGTDNIVPDPALQPQAPPHHWRETIDAATQQLYYYNAQTGEVTWDRPAEMGAAPMASGWFGRGAAVGHAHRGPTAAEYAANNERFLKRPARKQKDHIVADRSVLEGANEFNIWCVGWGLVGLCYVGWGRAGGACPVPFWLFS